jgi:replication factor C subunit 3/5
MGFGTNTVICSVKLTDDGKKALLKLSKGDMRRALNVLQACHAAYDLIGETEIYNCTGNPHPTDIETIVNSMLSDEFTTSYQSELQTTFKIFIICTLGYFFQ